MSNTPQFEIPTDVRKITEQSLEQIKTAIHGYLQFIQRAIPANVMGGSELTNKIFAYTEQNVASAFEFAERLVRALATRLRVIFESALGEVELWNKSAAAQLDAQLRERRRNFSRRIEAIERIQDAASGLDERIAEIESQEAIVHELDTKLTELTGKLIASPPSSTTSEDPHLQTA